MTVNHRIKLSINSSNVTQKFQENVTLLSGTPTEVVQMRLKSSSRDTTHLLQNSYLWIEPATFDGLGMRSGYWIHIRLLMVHGVVIKTKGIQSRMCRPFVRVDDGPSAQSRWIIGNSVFRSRLTTWKYRTSVFCFRPNTQGPSTRLPWLRWFSTATSASRSWGGWSPCSMRPLLYFWRPAKHASSICIGDVCVPSICGRLRMIVAQTSRHDEVMTLQNWYWIYRRKLLYINLN